MTKENIKTSGSDCKDNQSQISMHPEFQKHTEIISDPDRDSESFDAKIVQAIQEQSESFDAKIVQAIQEQSERFDKKLDGFEEFFKDSMRGLGREIRQNGYAIDIIKDRDTYGHISMRGFVKGFRSLQDGISDAKVEEL
jgi:hypothetical protein